MKAVNSFAGVLIYYNSSEILLAKRSKYCFITGDKVPYGGFWSIFSGSIEVKKIPLVAQKRELEETLIDLDKNLFLPHTILKEKNIDFHIFSVNLNKKPKVTLNQEHTEYDWFNLNKVHLLQPNIDKKILDIIKKV